MATKKFAQMSTVKLNKLMETASDEDKAAIQAILDKRAGVAESSQPIETADELTEEEKAAIQAAEAANNSAATPKAENKPNGRPASEKMSPEDRAALVEKLRAEAVNHRCQVVPFNTIGWVDGTVIGILNESRAQKVFYQVRLDDGRRMVKLYGSPLIRVLDEVVERPVGTATSRKKKGLDENGNPIEVEVTPWTDEEIEAAVQEVIENVGHMVSFPEAGKYGVVEAGAPTITGRITSIVTVRRSKMLMYRVEVPVEGIDEPRIMHKSTKSTDLVIEPELDEAGTKFNSGFKARRYKEETDEGKRQKMNAKERYDLATANLSKAKANLEKLQALIAKREAEFEAAKAAYEEAVANGETFEETTKPATEGADDLM